MPLTMPTDHPVHVLVTRPAAQSAAFAAQVEARFGDAAKVLVSPLMQIVFLPVEVDFGGFDAVVFTSQNGVAAYEALNGPVGMTAYCVGARTAEAARGLGLNAVAADGHLGSLNEGLAQAGALALLHLSGAHVTGEVAGNVTRVVAYDQRPLGVSAPAKALLERDADVIVPLFSPNAVRWFEAALPEQRQARLFAVCMSKMVAEGLHLPLYRNVRFMGALSAQGMLDKMSDFFPARPA